MTISQVPLFRSLVFCGHPRPSVCGSGEGLFYFPLRGSSAVYLPWCAASARLVPNFSPVFSRSPLSLRLLFISSLLISIRSFSQEKKKIIFRVYQFYSLSRPSPRRVFILFSAVSTTVRGHKSSSFNLGVIASGRDYVTPKATAAFCELFFTYANVHLNLPTDSGTFSTSGCTLNEDGTYLAARAAFLSL